MSNHSLTIKGAIITIASTIFGLAGIQIAPESLDGFMLTLMAAGDLIGAVIAWYGRWKKGDISLGGMRK